MASKKQPKPTVKSPVKRKATRGEIGDPAALEAATRAECERRFRATWGAPFLRQPAELTDDPTRPGGKKLAKDFVGHVAGFFDAVEKNKVTETKARELYGRLLTTLDDIAAFKKNNPYGTGGMVTTFMHVGVGGAPQIEELEALLPPNGLQWAQGGREGRPALIQQFGGVVGLVGRRLTDQELAVISILLGVGPGNYEVLLRQEGALRIATPAGVIHREAKAIASCRKAQRLAVSVTQG